MELWTAQGAFAVKAFYKNGDSFVIAQREFRRVWYSSQSCCSICSCIKTWVQNFEATGSTLKNKDGSIRTARTPKNVAAVREDIERSPRRSALRHATSVGLSEASVRRILHKDLHFYPYKIQITHALQEHGYENKDDFCQTFLQLINQNQDIVNNLLMSDEAHFHLSGFVNKQNFHYWSATNPKEIYERPLHSSEVTVRCAIGKAVTVTGPRYVHVLESFLAPALARLPVKEEKFFQQDGATCHTARISMAAVNNLFPNHVISRYGNTIWPARSADFSTCDFFLWGYLKSQDFKAPAPHTVQELKHRIQEEVERIAVEMLQRVMSDFRKRLTECLQRKGGHLSDVIFGK
ncbi:hypothetical protein B7P43_G10587 [Cryptotermes secundus]|uniref:DUF4817 domain-containing protein n=1 Tax=Cryptotermes secundus TaxID=105785 RepID=A0A2J7Q4C4_9NEOP|nr:hypothetical protein B7P43_G10587 [Cryptotermes secundus]